MGAAAIGYLQQVLPSQQAGFPQQLKADAAWADNERKRTAANANTIALSFIMISLNKLLRDVRTMTFQRAAYGIGDKGDDLNAEIVFEIKYGCAVTEARSEFTERCADLWAGPITTRILAHWKGL